MNKAAYALPVLAVLGAVGALTACGAGGAGGGTTGSGTTGSGIGSTPAPAGPGTEVIRASTTNLDATNVTVKASGVFADTGTLKLPIGSQRTITFKLARGNLVVLNATGPANGPLHLNKTTCAFSQTMGGTYRLLAGNSSGRYGGATGHGTYALNATGIAPKAPDGTCNTRSNAGPAKGHLTVRLRGPLTLNPGS
jgi:hypothetical protein